jgi:type II secretion system protein N
LAEVDATTSEPATARHGEPPLSSKRILWTLYGALSFVVFVLLTFPAELLLQRVVATLEQTTAVQVRYGAGEWSWLQGWTLHNLSIEKAGMAPFHVSRLTFSPSFFSLMYGQPFPLTYAVHLYGGAAKGTVQREGNGWRIQFSLEQLTLKQFPFPDPWGPGRVAGNLTIEGSLQGAPGDITSWSGNISASLTDGSLKAGNVAKVPLPAIQTAQARGQATLKSGRLDVPDLTLAADGIEAHLQGAISLRLPLEWSALDMQLTTRQTGAPPPTLAALVSLLPAAPGAQGERRATLTGTFAAPEVR